jgi:pyridoxal 5-phosphate dependent beta-lyase
VTRPPSSVPPVCHLDTAAAARQSAATRAAVVAHLEREAEVGAYIAEAEAAPRMAMLRQGLGQLLDVPVEGLAFTGGAMEGLDLLLRIWPLGPGSRVGVVPAAWGPNLEYVVAAGHVLELLEVDDQGHLDLDAFAARLAGDPPALVLLDHVPAHRGLRQPVAAAAALCRAHGVPLWVDAAQAVGQVVAPGGADATFGNSRKWLAGPRGVGILGVAEEHWGRLRIPPRAKYPDHPPMWLVESDEAHAAGRVGLAQAVDEYVARGPQAVAERLDTVGDSTRTALADLPGWQVLADQEGPITALRPTQGQDVVEVRQRLLDEHRILTTASLPWRAPYDLITPTLRVSPSIDVTAEDLTRLVDALAAI